MAGSAAGAGMSTTVPAVAVAASDPPAVQAVKKGYAAFGTLMATHNMEPLMGLLADDVVWESNQNGGFSSSGKEAAAPYFQYMIKVNDLQKFEPVKFTVSEAGNEVVSLVDMAGKGKLTGTPFSTTIVHLTKVDLQSGKIQSFREILDWSVVGPAMGPTPY